MKKNFGLYGPLLLILIQTALAEDSWIDQINQTIQKNGLEWKAAENWVTRLSPEARARLCGTILIPPPNAAEKFITLAKPAEMPAHFSWTDNNGNWVTSVKDQGDCGSCWSFASTAQVESWWKISNDDTSNLDLSEQFLISCSDAGDCDGGYLSSALNFFEEIGTPSESCLPYQERDDILCSFACANWESEAITIPGWGYITLDEDNIDNLKAAVYRHPVSAGFNVYTDFYAYTSGIYEHAVVEGEQPEGGHAVLIVGWDDEQEYWICKNSWNTSWGENGYFRIRWHNCELGNYVPHIYDELIQGPALSVSPPEIEVMLDSGDSSSITITLNNTSSKNLEFSAYDRLIEYTWHPDTQYAYEGKSWWAGNPDLGGYADHWLQYLETPVIDLHNTTAPVLNWMGQWTVEDPAGAEAPYDGWDGCNVWISTDGGLNFTVATPQSPAYNCQSLWSFGDYEQGWGMGPNIAGWGGSSNGWVPVSFDLKSFKSSNVIIRWALASDLAYSIIDDNSLFGMCVDNIVISDGATVIFEDDGEDIKTMNQWGDSGYNPAPWINILNGGGYLQPGSNSDMMVKINTQGMKPGFYRANIEFTSNDTSASNPIIPCKLEILAADHDLYVDAPSIRDSYGIQTKIPISAEISNFGQNDESDIQVICTFHHGDEVRFSQTKQINTLLIGQTVTVNFDPFYVAELEYLKLEVSATIPNDANEANNHLTKVIQVTNLIDDFETTNDLWIPEHGAGRMSNLVEAYSGSYVYSMSVIYPYLNTTNSKLTYRSGFDISGTDYAAISFWVNCYTETKRDYFYIEASTDSLNWIKLDSLTGIQSYWIKKVVDLSQFIVAHQPKVWIRFHFVAGGGRQGLHFAIDDFSFYNQYPPTTIVSNDQSLPEKWQLQQNFPNPFNATTTIHYSMPENSQVKIVIYDLFGRRVKELHNSFETAGYKSVTWNGTDDSGRSAASGVYFYLIESPRFRAVKKMLLIK